MYAVINTAAAADNEIVAAVAGKRIVVTSYVLYAAGTVNVTWKRATTALSGPLPMKDQGIVVCPLAPMTIPSGKVRGYIATERDEALNLTLDAGVQVSGHITYELDN